tara:strand:+ start:121 stop:303 length:183 start_codon:yes stop_codon:yes gene_type:complete
MNLFQVVHKEINEKQDLLLDKLSSGSVKDHAEYSYVCGNISALRALSDYITELESKIEDD